MTFDTSSTVPAATNAMRILAYKSGAPTITWDVTENSANARLHPNCKDFLDQDWRKFVFRSEGAVNTGPPKGSTTMMDIGGGECGSITLVVNLYEWPASQEPHRHSIKIFPSMNRPGITVDLILRSITKLLQEAYEDEKRIRRYKTDLLAFVTIRLGLDTTFAGLVATDLPYVYEVIFGPRARPFIHTDCATFERK